MCVVRACVHVVMHLQLCVWIRECGYTSVHACIISGDERGPCEGYVRSGGVCIRRPCRGMIRRIPLR